MAFVAGGGVGAARNLSLAKTCEFPVKTADARHSTGKRCVLRMTATEKAPAVVGEAEAENTKPENDDWKVKLLYDGECPICMREVVFLLKKDAGRGLIKFVDIATEDYDPAENAGVRWEKAMGRIHAVLPDDTVITGVKVFQKTYDVIGLGWLFSATKLPVVGNVAEGVYDIWAKNRLRITGRKDLEEIIREKEELARQLEEEGDCEDTCKADYEDEEEEDLGLQK